MPLVEIRNLAKRFGGLTAVFDLDLDIEPGVIQGLIGPNGAGKTTTLNMLGGSLFPTKGEITFKGKDITRLSPYQRAQRGIARVFQHDVLFSSFTVLENILVAFHLQSGTNVGEILFGGASTLRRKKAMRHKAMELLHFVGLDSLADEPAINLPHGNQRLLGLAIALATQPQLLLLDEPVTGMNAEEVARARRAAAKAPGSTKPAKIATRPSASWPKTSAVYAAQSRANTTPPTSPPSASKPPPPFPLFNFCFL